MDRAHRIGQKKEVQVFRFCIDNSIEEKVCFQRHCPCLNSQTLPIDAHLLKTTYDRSHPSANICSEFIISCDH